MTWNPFKLRTQKARLQKEVAELRIARSIQERYVQQLEKALMLKDSALYLLVNGEGRCTTPPL
jgi:hypothetical protein